MSLKQIDLLLYVWLLINAIGWFGFLALPRLRKSLSCKEKADGIVEDIVETQNTKGHERSLEKRRACDRLLSKFQTGKCICQKRCMDRKDDSRNCAATCYGGYRDCPLHGYSLNFASSSAPAEPAHMYVLICWSFLYGRKGILYDALS